MVWNEGKLRFSFSEQWQIIKLDQHPQYLQGIEKLDGTKAVDFVGLFNQRDLYFIFLKQIKAKVAWLTNRVSVVALNSLTHQLPDVQIHHLPIEKS